MRPGCPTVHLFGAAVLALLLPALVYAAPWRLVQPEPPEIRARALVNEPRGATLAVFRNDNGAVFMEFTTAASGGLGRSSCPTFQVDNRTPQHFYPLGERCRISGQRARYLVTRIVSDTAVSLVLYRLINGNRIAFRYVSQDGTYHESVFSLNQSKQALLAALGETLTVDPGTQ